MNGRAGISNLVHALIKRMGWCPKPPALKDIIPAKMALNKGMSYVEKPPISLATLIAPIYSWGACFIVWLMTQYAISMTPPSERETAVFSIIYLMIYIFLVSGLIMPIPFILKRELSITNDKFHIKFGFFEDNISLYDIESFERLKRRPLMFFGHSDWCSGPEGWLTWGWGFFILGVAKIKGVKWYVFGMKHTYFRVNKRNGDAVCVGVKDPKLFEEELSVKMPDVKTVRTEFKHQQIPVEELYDRLLHIYVSMYGFGKLQLDNKIESYIKKGLSRDEAICKLAKIEQLIEYDEYAQTPTAELYKQLLFWSINPDLLERRIEKMVEQGLTREQAIRKIAEEKRVLKRSWS